MSLRLQQGMAVMSLGARRSPWQPSHIPLPVTSQSITGNQCVDDEKNNYSDVGGGMGTKQTVYGKAHGTALFINFVAEVKHFVGMCLLRHKLQQPLVTSSSRILEVCLFYIFVYSYNY